MARASRKRREVQDTATSGRRRHRRMNLTRALGLLAFLPLASRAPLYARLFWELLRDDRTPGGRKALLAVALGYVVLGREFIPDDMPLIGGVDDIVVVVLAVDLFLDGIPDEVLGEKLDELGIEPRAFQDDVNRIRRFTPAPLRRIMRRAPELVTFAGETLRNSGIGPKVRSWINT